MDHQPNSSIPSSSSSFSYSWTYDVFLSFRGSDTRYHFTYNLYQALTDKGIRTFFDDRELKGGDKITPSLVKAIKESRIAIVVFSKNYASSSFCLDELATIMEFVKGENRLVYPIFYDVEPNVVRHQKESYGEAMAKHKERFKDEMGKVDKWMEALRQAANLSGEVVKKGKGYEHDYIKNIIREILNKIHHAPLFVTKHPVGLESRVQDVCHLLDLGSHSEVIMVGIHGIGGIGKTTLAKAVYNFIALQFEGCCFLEKVSEKMIKHGLEHLQEVVISKLFGIKDIKVDNVSEGIRDLQRLRQKKVILILDDVDDREQLRTIVGAVDWFGSGSRVIITTRHMQLLESHKIKRQYEVQGLRNEEAHQLLSWNAFGCENSDPSYKDISKQAVTYACGLPLALEVIGSNLHGKGIEEWIFTLARYKEIPPEDIQKILQISFDGLIEFQRKLFLDIACCLIGYKWSEVIYILQACYDVPVEYDINMLVKKSLLKKVESCVTTHDFIRDMAREIIRLQSPEHYGNRSRLWSSKDIIKILKEDSGSGEIGIIILDAPKNEQVVVEWGGNAFMKMENLKILTIRNASFSVCAKYLPDSLRMLEWQNYPSNLLPLPLHSKKQEFNHLKVLIFDNSDIFKIPDVSSAPNLEKLSFQHCKKLIKVHRSVGFLEKLLYLSVSGCSKLKSFPALKLPCLERLDFDDCSSLNSYPEILCDINKLTRLLIMNTSIKELPSSFTKLGKLESLNIYKVHGIVRIPSCILSTLPSIGYFYVSQAGGIQCLKEKGQGSSTVSSKAKFASFTDCNMLDESLIVFLALFRNVVSLNLAGNNFTILPESIKELCSLRHLCLDNCQKLEEIRGIPPNIQDFAAVNCMSLSPSSRSKLLDKEFHSSGGGKRFFLPENRCPKWLEPRRKAEPISFWFRNELPPLSLCVPGLISFRAFINGSERNTNELFSNDLLRHFDAECITIFDLEISLENKDEFLSRNEWNRVDFSFWTPTEFGIHIHTKENNMEDFRFTDPLQQTSSSTSVQGDINKWEVFSMDDPPVYEGVKALVVSQEKKALEVDTRRMVANDSKLAKFRNLWWFSCVIIVIAVLLARGYCFKKCNNI